MQLYTGPISGPNTLLLLVEAESPLKVSLPVESTMYNICPECGATTPTDGACRDNFHALLLLESEVPGGPGSLAHFLVVGSYVLQHPESMGYTAEALAGLRRILGDALEGRASLDRIRRRVRHVAEGTSRVTRRGGDEVVRWQIAAWPMTVADVFAAGIEGNAGCVEHWARSILDTLASSGT
jgi:hypothetical protein